MSNAGKSVQPEWCIELPLQQQSVLLLAARGPDGIGKTHPTKKVQRAYRACVLKGAYYGDVLPFDYTGRNSFMEMVDFADRLKWNMAISEFFEYVDELPHHFIMHLLHGAEILGYKHPEHAYRVRWLDFYMTGVIDMHLFLESEEELDRRLNDVFDDQH